MSRTTGCFAEQDWAFTPQELSPLPGAPATPEHPSSRRVTSRPHQAMGGGWHQIEKVALAGLTSHTCVENAVRHALEEGFHVTFLRDAVSEFTQEAHDAALTLSYPSFGHEVLTIDQFLAAVETTQETKLRRA